MGAIIRDFLGIFAPFTYPNCPYSFDFLQTLKAFNVI